MGVTGGAIATWWAGLSAGTQAAIGATAASVAGAGVSKALSPGAPHVGIPPPPGAAMIDPAGSSAAAALRQRQAAAGGLNSTIGAGANPQSNTASGATSGQKQLLGG